MSKYNARKTQIDGHTFDSLAEAARYRELRLLERAGELSELKVHPVYLLQDAFSYRGKRERAIYYEADFEYRDPRGVVVEDVKGVETDVFKLKRKLFLALYGDRYIFEVVKA